MRSVLGYISEYARTMNRTVLAATSVLTALLIFINYGYRLDAHISRLPFLSLLFSRYLVFITAFLVPYIFYAVFAGRDYFNKTGFILLALVAPSFFALKTALGIDLPFTNDAAYWNKVLYWPSLLAVMAMLLLLTYYVTRHRQGFYGFTTRNLKWRPYIVMLLVMVPLIGIASTQPDFLHTYPKLQNLEGTAELSAIPWWKKALFELSYGSDFISIELFFRGFLIIAFVKWAGKDSILPMACFYCTIHFGKPLAECISSYFGGMLLGILVYNTRSILGGLMVHLGIAWLMEIGGYIGNGLNQ